MTLHTQANMASDLGVSPLYAHQWDESVIPRTKLGEASVAPSVAVALVRDELLLDGNARLNLATFCSTYLEPELAALAAENITKNIINHDEYPAAMELEGRCVSIIGDLWHGNGQTVGTAATGSSEAVMLAVLAARQRWREARPRDGQVPAQRGAAAREAAAREAAQRGAAGQPNLIFSTACHPCWDKACLYFDVEPRKLPVEAGRTTLDPRAAAAACDQNTIGVVATLGYPATGAYDPVRDICNALEAMEQAGGPSVEVHVDGASGAFVAPFQDRAQPWDFQLPRVMSINASGHKFGLANLGLGWILWRDHAHLPASLTFECNLLGGQPVQSFSLTFSRPAAPVIDQYATFIRLGRAGYTGLVARGGEIARYLAREIVARGFEIWGAGADLPVVSFGGGPSDDWDVRHLAAKLRERGWQVPTYSLPPDAEDITLARFVCRHGLTNDLASRLIADIDTSMAELHAHQAPLPNRHRASFHLA